MVEDSSWYLQRFATLKFPQLIENNVKRVDHREKSVKTFIKFTICGCFFFFLNVIVLNH